MVKISKLFILVIIFVLLLPGIIYPQIDSEEAFKSARILGLGGSYMSLSEDASAALFNPAGLITLERATIAASYGPKFRGLEEGSFSDGALLFSRYLGRKNAFGVGVIQSMSNGYNESKFSVSFGRRLWTLGEEKGLLSVGVIGNLYRSSLQDRAFSDDFNQNDPLVTSNSAYEFGVDVSSFLKYEDLKVGLGFFNLNKPSLSFANSSEAPLSRELRVGVAYDLFRWFLPTFQVNVSSFSSDKSAIQRQPDFQGGVESWFWNEKIGVRLGYCRRFMSVGFSYNTKTSYNVGIDYTYLQYHSTINKIANTQRVSVNFGFPLPSRGIKLFSDIVESNPEVLKPNKTGIIKGKVENVGELPEDFTVTAFYKPEGGSTYELIGTSDKINLKVDETKEVKLKWAPPEKGWYNVYLAADVSDIEDKATSKVSETIVEKPEKNDKVATGKIPVFNRPDASTPKFSRPNLSLSKEITIREEIPMYPHIYFDKKSAEILPRFHDELAVIANRLKTNPGVEAKIYGYYDVRSDGKNKEKLAYQRATNIKKTLVDSGVASGRIKVVREDYDNSLERSLQASVDEVDKDRISEEDRRARIKVEPMDFDEFIAKYKLGKEQVDIDSENKAAFRESLLSVKDFMAKNEGSILLFRGGSSEEGAEGWLESLKRAEKLRAFARNVLGKEFSDRVFIANAEEKNKDFISAIITCEDILFRPRQIISGGGEDLGKPRNFVKMESLSVQAGVDSYSVRIKEESGEVFKHLAQDTGSMPKSVAWDWHGDEGQPPDEDTKYYGDVFIKDNVGQTLSVRSEPASIEIEREQSREELQIVNFSFGSAKSESKYLESRFGNAARDLINKAQEAQKSEDKLRAVIGGHTDIIGGFLINKRLSRRRAQKELRHMRIYLRILLNLDSEKALDRWLREHNTTLEAKGFAYSKPYKVRVWRGGTYDEKLIGDNRLPEGRYMNRRVTLEYDWVR